LSRSRFSRASRTPPSTWCLTEPVAAFHTSSVWLISASSSLSRVRPVSWRRFTRRSSTGVSRVTGLPLKSVVSSVEIVDSDCRS